MGTDVLFSIHYGFTRSWREEGRAAARADWWSFSRGTAKQSPTRSTSMRRSAYEGGDGSTSVPGKPFLAHLLATLKHQQRQRKDHVTSHRAGRRRSHSRDALSSWETVTLDINAPCLFYLQQLFRTMLTPVRSAAAKPKTDELIRQWRVDGAFRGQMDDMQLCAALGPASPRRILQLAGHLLELKALMIQAIPVELNVCMPSDCDLAIFPSLQYLQIDLCALSNIRNMNMMTSRLKVRSQGMLVWIKTHGGTN